MTRRRLDEELVRRGLARSRSEARDTILAGRVIVSGSPAGKPGGLVGPAEPVAVAGPGRPFVSRGGEKLAAALDRFEVDPSGLRCLDAGAGTGGFTDVLLDRGASHVVAVDVGYGQFDWALRTDERVTVLERVNVRDLEPAHLPFAPELLVADLSFISLTKVIPALVRVAAPRANFVLLVKPQFEAGRNEVGRGGVVSDPDVWRTVIERIAEACRAHGIGPRRVMASPLLGPAGNVEFPLHGRAGGPAEALPVDEAVREGRRLRERRGRRADG